MPKKKIIARVGVPGFTNKAVPDSTDAFLLEDGATGEYHFVTKDQLATIFGSSGTWFDLTSTISGTTHTLSHTPVSKQGYFIDGQRCSTGVGKKILSIVGTLVTFDADYTGQDFTETYEY